MKQTLSVRVLCLAAIALLGFLGFSGVRRSNAQDPPPRLLHQREAIPEQYIVVFGRQNPTPLAAAPTPEQTSALIQHLAAAYNARVGHIYTNGLQGFSAHMSPEDALRMSRDPNVLYVEEDGIVRISTEQLDPPSWGLSRICTRQLQLPHSYIYPSTAGAGITVYVLDTGIQTTQPDFEGRAKIVLNYYPAEGNTDLNGHGTHVAGIIGSTTYGVAKRVILNGIKVLSAYGSGPTSNVIAGLQYVTAHAVPGKTVVNMSLGGGLSAALNNAVNAAAAAGVVVIAAAGNDNADACYVSPASAPGAMAVGATGATDTRAYYSNWGTCVGLYAPGTSITSLWIGPNGATNTISGTSMASPHVAGIAALFMTKTHYTSAESVYNTLKSFATPGIVKGNLGGGANRLAYEQ